MSYESRYVAESYEGLVEAVEVPHRDADFAAYIQAEIQKLFPHSRVLAMVKDFIGQPSVYIQFTILKQGEYPNNISDNDPLMMKIFVNGINQQTHELNAEVTTTMAQGRLTLKSTHPYMAYDSMKLPFRKTTGTPEKVAQYLIQYFGKVKTLVKANIDNLHDSHRELIQAKVR